MAIIRYMGSKPREVGIDTANGYVKKTLKPGNNKIDDKLLKPFLKGYGRALYRSNLILVIDEGKSKIDKIVEKKIKKSK